jgi:hypothetical protein
MLTPEAEQQVFELDRIGLAGLRELTEKFQCPVHASGIDLFEGMELKT